MWADLVPDPTQVPELKILFGFLGKSPRDGYWRLYPTAELNVYDEFSAEDVVHYQRLNATQSPLGGTFVWLNRDAKVQHTQTGTRQAQAGFLQGEIIAELFRKQNAAGTFDLTGRIPPVAITPATPWIIAVEAVVIGIEISYIAKCGPSN